MLLFLENKSRLYRITECLLFEKVHEILEYITYLNIIYQISKGRKSNASSKRDPEY